MTTTRRMMQTGGSVLVLALLAGGTPPRTAQAQHGHASTVTIAVSVPLNQFAALANGIVYGVKVAVAQANATNVVPGVTFDTRVLDDTVNNQFSPTKDAMNARSFIADPSVIGEVGPLNSGAAKISMPVYNDAGLVQISPANTYPGLTDPMFRAEFEPATATGKEPITYFRTVTTDYFQGLAAALYAVKTLHIKRVFVTDNTDSYGVVLAKAFENESKRLGVTVVGYAEEDASQPEMGSDALAANIANASGGRLDLVYFGGEYGPSGGGDLLADALKAHGVHAIFMGGDGIYAQDFITGSSNGGVLGAYATNAGAYAQQYSPARGFLATEARMFPGKGVSWYDVEAYDAANVIIAAYARAVKGGTLRAGQAMGLASRTMVARLVAQTRNFKGATGVFSFDANGDTTNRVISLFMVTGSGANATWTYVGVAPQP